MYIHSSDRIPSTTSATSSTTAGQPSSSPSSSDQPAIPQPTHDLPSPRTFTAIFHPQDVPSFAVSNKQYEEFGVSVKKGKTSDAVSYVEAVVGSPVAAVEYRDESTTVRMGDAAKPAVVDVSGRLEEFGKQLDQLLQDNEETRLGIPRIRRDWLLFRHETLLSLNKVLAVYFRRYLLAQASSRQKKRFKRMGLVKLLPYIQHHVASAARPAAALLALASTTLFLLHPRQKKVRHKTAHPDPSHEFLSTFLDPFLSSLPLHQRQTTKIELIMKVQQASSTPSMTTARTDSANDPPAAVAPNDVDTSESIPSLKRKMHAVHQYYLNVWGTNTHPNFSAESDAAQDALANL